MCYHRTNVDTQLSKFVVYLASVARQITGDLGLPSLSLCRFRENGSHEALAADRPYAASSRVTFAWSSSLGARAPFVASWAAAEARRWAAKRQIVECGRTKCLEFLLSVMQGQRVNMPNTATLGELDRLQPMFSGNDIYFTYHETDDVIATIRWSVVRGLGQVIGSV